MLEPHRLDFPVIKQQRRVIYLALFLPERADQQGRAAIGGLGRQRLDCVRSRFLKGATDHKIFGRVTGHDQFTRHQ